MATLVVPGIPDSRREPSELSRGLPATMVATTLAARVESSRAGIAALRLENVDLDDVVEMELEDGVRLWTRVDDLQEDFRLAPARDAAAGVIELRPTLSIGPPSRGWVGWAIKALKIVRIDIAKSIGNFVADHVEAKLDPGPGLYRCSVANPSELTPVGPMRGPGPTLVFLHGTASSTMGSFGELWTGRENAPMQRLFERYEGRILALQHRTLTESPIENAAYAAARLLEVLDAGAEIHLVSHSRGGLVGELLARGMRVGSVPFTDEDLDLFGDTRRTRDRAALESLNQTLQRARFRVTRFVRVGCPARGTTLADGRLDRYFSVLVNVVGWIPALKANPVYDGLTSLLAGVLKQRTKPEDLPGLEAQMPGSPLVRMLNRPGIPTAADLHVLGGDLEEGGGLLGRLKTFATDLYYREDHDLVVNTPSMFGGMERKDGVKYWIDTGPEVTHFHYFARSDTAGRLVAALTSDREDYHELRAEPFAVTANDYRKRAAVTQPVVFVLPGIMGSELSIAGNTVWVHIVALAAGGLAALRFGADVQATGLIGSAYGAVCRYLSANHDVVPFPYDWRVSIEESAERLREAIEARLPDAESHNQPIRLLAHSMGGLVVRAMFATPEGQATWARMCRHPDARFIMLGTPNQGSFSIPAMLLGRDAMVKKLALLDVRNSYAELLTTIAAFPGVLDLMPSSGTGTLDLLDAAGWQKLYDHDVPSDRGLFSSSIESSKSAGFKWAIPTADGLARARAVRSKVLGAALDPSRTVYVAGVADETAVDIEIDAGAREGRRVLVHASAHGDGRVPWKTGIPPGVPVYYVEAAHGDLASTESAFPALVDILTTGKTTQLSTTPPARRSAATETFPMREVLPAMIPDREEIVSSALGARRRPGGRVTTQRRIRVTVIHDDVVNAKTPVLVGHYEHDVIFGAEAYLDDQLAGRLTELRDMELYPGPIGTAVVAMNSPDSTLNTHPGAIVAGLGIVGDLTAGRLTRTLAQALTTYGAERVGLERRRRQRRGEREHQPRALELGVTALLVGSGETGVSLVDSVQSLLRAVVTANERLTAGTSRTLEDGGTAPALTAQIVDVDIVELYEDRAIAALHALRGLARSGEMARFAIDDLLERGADGCRRARFDAAPGWWQRVRVKTLDDDSLQIEALTQLARIPAYVQPTQRRAVAAFLRRATSSTAYERSLGQTLFEMLVPNDFKMHAADRRNLLLMLDPQAAAFPWELLNDRFDRGSRPLAVASSMVRQLLVDRGRDQVLRAPDPTAFVVGNPVVTDPRFPTLPGASDEAHAVAAILREQRYTVLELVGAEATPMAVMTALHERPWQIMHLAAHGVFQFEPSPGVAPVSGLVLDDGIFFTAADVEQMRHVPDLVFINCCHLGQTAGEKPLFTSYHELAANLAVQLIKMGVRAVVAAGWAVDDAAAKTFARTFYEEMFEGQMFGEAVARARARVYEQHGSTNTWGAYQCYGDPSFSLVKGARPGIAEPVVSDLETIIKLEDIRRRARTARPGADLQRELEALVASTPQVWWQSSRLCAAAGEAFGEVKQFETALRYYEMATAFDKADAPIATLEQLANLRVRWATQLAESNPDNLSLALDHLQRAQRLVKAILEIGETNERYSMLGSLEKRRAMLLKGPERTRAVADMGSAYTAACRIARTIGPSAVAYSLSNALAARVIRLWALPRDGAEYSRALVEIDEGLTALKDAATRLADSSTNFFDLSTQGTSTLLAALKTGVLEERSRKQVEAEYRRAGSRGASPRHVASMRDQVAFFEEMARSEIPAGSARDALLASLGRLRNALAE